MKNSYIIILIALCTLSCINENEEQKVIENIDKKIASEGTFIFRDYMNYALQGDYLKYLYTNDPFYPSPMVQEAYRPWVIAFDINKNMKVDLAIEIHLEGYDINTQIEVLDNIINENKVDSLGVDPPITLVIDINEDDDFDRYYYTGSINQKFISIFHKINIKKRSFGRMSAFCRKQYKPTIFD